MIFEDWIDSAVASAWGAAFTYSFNALVAQLGEELATKQAKGYADQVAGTARKALSSIKVGTTHP